MTDPARYRGADGVYRFPHDRPAYWWLLTPTLVVLVLSGVLPFLVTEGRDRVIAAAIGLPFAVVMVGGLWVLWKRRLDIHGRRLHRFNGLQTVSGDAIDLDDVVMAGFTRRRPVPGRVGHARRLSDPARIVLVTKGGSGHRGLSAWEARRRVRRLDADALDRLEQEHSEVGFFAVLIDDFSPDTRSALLRFLSTELPRSLRETARTWS